MTHFVAFLSLLTTTMRRHLAPSSELPARDPGDHRSLEGLSPRDFAVLPLPRPALWETRAS